MLGYFDEKNKDILIIEVAGSFRRGINGKSLVDTHNIKVENKEVLKNNLLSYLKKAIDWQKELELNKISIAELSKRKNIDASTISRVLALNYLAPDIIENIILGNYPATLSARELIHNAIPYDWELQRSIYGFK
ncbi:MAG: hypothetical protein R3Y43_04125 [Alphaproteobacteria bacterium]